MSPNHRDHKHKGSQLILPGGSTPEAEADEAVEIDAQIVEMISQQALQLVASNIAVAALVGEVAKLSGDASAFAQRLKKSSLAILKAMPMPDAEPEMVGIFHETVSENLDLIFEMLRSINRE